MIKLKLILFITQVKRNLRPKKDEVITLKDEVVLKITLKILKRTTHLLL